MLINGNYNFEVSLSKESFSDKIISGAMIGTSKNEDNRKIRKQYGFSSNKGISFERTSITCKGLLDSLLDGKVFCHLFNPTSKRKDNTFGSSQKKDVNFNGSYVIGVDIDHTNYETAEDYISKLSIKPSLYYTSYSNMQLNEDGTSKGARFRLIYVFDKKIKNPYYFRFCSFNLNRILEKDTEELITDDCNLRCSQYFNGTNKNNKDIILSYACSDLIYSLGDINSSDMDKYIKFLCEYAHYKTVTIKRTNEIKNILKYLTKKNYIFIKKIKQFILVEDNDINSTTINDVLENKTTQNFEENSVINTNQSLFSKETEFILNDFDRLDIEEFKKCTDWEKARRNTKYIYRLEKEWINNLYQYVDDDYFSLFYYNSTVRDGSKRRKSLYQRMCLRRLLKPTITADEMVVNTIIDIMRFFDNTDGLLNSDFIKRNVESAFNLDLEDIKTQYQETIKYLKETTRPKRGIIYNGRQAHSKETTYEILDEYYNTSLSVSENLDILYFELGFKFEKSTIYNYLKARELKTDSNKLNDEELKLLLDIDLSARKNYELLKISGIKISRERVTKLLNELKDYVK